MARHAARGVGDGARSGTIAVALAVFCLLHGGLRRDRCSRRSRLDAIRAVALPRAAVRAPRRPPSGRSGSGSWPRSPSRLAARAPAFASQVSERDIIRAGFDPAVAHPGRGLRRQARARRRDPRGRRRPHPAVRRSPCSSRSRSPSSATSSRPSTSARAAKARQAQLARELPDFLALVRPLAAKHGLEHAVADVADALHDASDGREPARPPDPQRRRRVRHGHRPVRRAARRRGGVGHRGARRAGRCARAVPPARQGRRRDPRRARAIAPRRRAQPARSVRPRRCSRSSPRSSPASTCPSSSCSSSCPVRLDARVESRSGRCAMNLSDLRHLLRRIWTVAPRRRARPDDARVRHRGRDHPRRARGGDPRLEQRARREDRRSRSAAVWDMRPHGATRPPRRPAPRRGGRRRRSRPSSSCRSCSSRCCSRSSSSAASRTPGSCSTRPPRPAPARRRSSAPTARSSGAGSRPSCADGGLDPAPCRVDRRAGVGRLGRADPRPALDRRAGRRSRSSGTWAIPLAAEFVTRSEVTH